MTARKKPIVWDLVKPDKDHEPLTVGDYVKVHNRYKDSYGLVTAVDIEASSCHIVVTVPKVSRYREEEAFDEIHLHGYDEACLFRIIDSELVEEYFDHLDSKALGVIKSLREDIEEAQARMDAFNERAIEIDRFRENLLESLKESE
ncbi:MAG: hypothetical protein LKJ05_02695 [Bifidobacteriaceae bacterium]|nr:hypothetical protein [Bifidobacteriaceae bacterium]